MGSTISWRPPLMKRRSLVWIFCSPSFWGQNLGEKKTLRWW